MATTRAAFRDIAERTVATALEAGVAYLATRLVDIGPEWVVIGTPILALIKSKVSTFFGTKTASAIK